MPRVARQSSATGFYHVMMRGINRENIFGSKAAKKEILEILSAKTSDADMDIYAYCVMDNHIHLLVKAELQELSMVMKKVNGSFAMYYNKEKDRIGSVFQGRFRSEQVEDQAHFWGVMRYIHLNPVKACMVQKATDYPWSSIRYFLTGKSQLLADNALSMKQDNFKDNESFLYMHEEEDLGIYLEVTEELDDVKKTVSERMLEMTLSNYDVNSILELREKEEALERLLRCLKRDVKLSYQEIAKLTGLSYSMVRRIIAPEAVNE